MMMMVMFVTHYRSFCFSLSLSDSPFDSSLCAYIYVCMHTAQGFSSCLLLLLLLKEQQLLQEQQEQKPLLLLLFLHCG